MQPPPPLDPDVADTAPSGSVLTGYDQEHLVTYLRLLDADAEGADWREVAAPDARSIAIWRAPTPLRVLRKIALREPVSRRVG